MTRRAGGMASVQIRVPIFRYIFLFGAQELRASTA